MPNIRNKMSQSSAKKQIHAFVSFWLDYFNPLLTGRSKNELKKPSVDSECCTVSTNRDKNESSFIHSLLNPELNLESFWLDAKSSLVSKTFYPRALRLQVYLCFIELLKAEWEA